MALNAESNPMRWPAGPLDIALQEKTKGFTTDKAAVLRNWLDPATLGILQGTPVNTLVVNWAYGLPADSEQQQALTPLIEKGREIGVGLVGVIDGEANTAKAIAAARSAGLIAVTMEGEATADAGIPVIQRNADARIRWGGKSQVLSLTNGIWPGIPQDVNQAGGPTNLPWVDSNGAALRIARALAPEKDVWIEFNPPQQTAAQTAEAYMLAVADLLQLRGEMGGVAGRRLARRPEREKTAGHGYLEESHGHDGLLQRTQPEQELSADGTAGAGVELRRRRLGPRRRDTEPAASVARTGQGDFAVTSGERFVRGPGGDLLYRSGAAGCRVASEATCLCARRRHPICALQMAEPGSSAHSG